MNLSRRTYYLLLLIAVCLLGGCYEDAADKVISDETVVNSDDDNKGDDRTVGQNLWTYEQMKNDYLWEEYLPDTSALPFSEYPKQFFERLRYKGDRFSWIEPNLDFETASFYDYYGLDYATYQTPAGDLVHRALLVRKEAQARKAGLKRGDWFKITDDTGTRGVTILKGIIEGGTFRPQQQISLQAQTQEEYTSAVLLDSVYQIDDRRVAYLFYTEFMDVSSILNNPYRAELKAIFAKFKQQEATDLIVDLRYNHGGYVSICQYLGSLILQDEFLGEISGYHSYNKRLAAEQYEKTGNEEEVLFFIGTNIIDGNNLGLSKAYFIITEQSASASESLINSLSPFIDVVTIGETSTGKGVGSWTIQSREYEWQLQPITFRYYNREHETVPDSGLTPNIFVDEAQTGHLYELGDTHELLLSTALNEITSPELRSASVYEKTELIPVASKTSHRRKTEGYIHQLQ
jgi:C-terminal processing protease CtpA/Prc